MIPKAGQPEYKFLLFTMILTVVCCFLRSLTPPLEPYLQQTFDFFNCRLRRSSPRQGSLSTSFSCSRTSTLRSSTTATA
jgi:hypothetical protein